MLLAMRALDILRKKRDGQALDPSEIEAFVRGVCAGEWPDYQAAALLMAIVLRGMNADETAQLTRAMVEAGARLDWSDLPEPKVDKHSTGGVGDKTSLIVAPYAAACCCVVTMMSGRGLAHSGGTLDKLEAIPGFRALLSAEQMRGILKKTGCVMVGPTHDVAPADKILYALRDVTATVESIPLITASILSKKIAEGIDALVMDVKCGQGAFMKTRNDARALAEAIVATGNANHLRTEAILTAMDAPLGRMVGNALEVREAIATLRGDGPSDLQTLSVALAARMVLRGGLAAALEQAEGRVRAALTSGQGVERLRIMIAEQGGEPRVVDDPNLLPAKRRNKCCCVPAPSGWIGDIHAELVGMATMLLGAGRERVDDAIDHAVGVRILAKPGEAIKAGEPFVEVHFSAAGQLREAVALLNRAWRIDDEPPAQTPLILECVS